MRLILMVTGLAAGILAAGGVVSLVTGLGVITRFAGLSRTAGRSLLYENWIIAGAVTGTILTVMPFRDGLLPGMGGQAAILTGGLFFGIFVGGWIMALAEITDIFPIVFRRFRITKGLVWIVISMATGKVLGGLLLFSGRWGM